MGNILDNISGIQQSEKKIYSFISVENGKIKIQKGLTLSEAIFLRDTIKDGVAVRTEGLLAQW